MAKCSDQFRNRDLRFKRIPFFVRSIISGNKSSDVTWFSLLIDNSNLQSKIVKSSEFSRVIRQHFALEIRDNGVYCTRQESSRSWPCVCTLITHR